jgi:hypothetical protein
MRILPATLVLYRPSIAGVNLPLTLRHGFAAVPQSRRRNPAGPAPASTGIFHCNSDSFFQMAPMTQELLEQSRQRPAYAHRAFVALTLALAVSVVVAFTVVSIGIARAAM